MSKHPAAFLTLPLALAMLLAANPAQAQLRGPGSRLVQSLPAGSQAVINARADFIVAIVNADPITYRELVRQTLRAEQQLTQQGAAMPNRDALARQVLEKLIDDRVLVQHAQEAGIKIEDSTLDDAIAGIAKQNKLTPEQLYRQLQSDGIEKGRFRRDIREELMVNRLRERDFESRVRVSDSEVDEYIREQSGADASANLQINLAQILIEVPEQADAATVDSLRQKTERLRKRLLAGEAFDQISRDFSAAANRNESGIIGLRPSSRYPDAFVEATRTLTPGGLSEVIQTGAGFHILKLVEKKQAGLPAMNVIQTRSRHILLQPQPPRTTDQDAIQQLRELRQRIVSGASFEDLARQFSTDGSASQGGDLGWASPGQFVPEFEQVLNALPAGAISDPFVSRFGVHIVQVLGRRNQTLSETEQRETVRQMLREKRIQERLPQWVQDIRANAYVEYRQAPDQ